MSEIEIEAVADAIAGHGPGVVGGAALLYAANRVFGKTADVISEELAQFTKTNIDAFRQRAATKIFEKTAHLSQNDDWSVHPRTALHVLNHATLYDDNLMQSYVAGLLAGSRNTDGSDDRAIYYLTLIDGLTARQLQTFHLLYSAVTGYLTRERTHINLLHHRGFVVEVSEFDSEMARVFSAPDVSAAASTAAFVALSTAGLVQHLSVHLTDQGEQVIMFTPTVTGLFLFDWAHGIDEDDPTTFAERQRPYLGIPAASFASIYLQP